MKRQDLLLLAVFCLLIAIGAAGRLGQPMWNFTPLAAVGLFAGRYFANTGIAIAVPLIALLIGDLVSPSHTNFGVMLAVYGSLAMPALLGRWLRRPVVKECPVKERPVSQRRHIARWVTCLLAPSLIFFVTTNFAVWALHGYYAKTFAGLVECYVAAIPFYRTMLTGDLIYSAMLFGGAALAGVRYPEATSDVGSDAAS